MDEEPDTIATPSPNIPEDYSDLGSINSEDPASDRQKYQRGGRKQSTSRWNSLSESRLPPLGPDYESDREEEQEKEPSPPEDRREKEPARPRATPFKTGISSFNLRRAEDSGGRPMGVKIDDPTTKVSEQEFDQERRKTGQTRPDAGKQREERPQREPGEKKPVQIRLDLNLMIEVFLRAKIQGDVTITFL
jgi:YD repeat-containing protein